MAVAIPPEVKTRSALIVAAGCVAMVFVVVLMWGPVARGLHEQSIERWCRWSPSVATASLDVDRTLEIATCVEHALSDPGYMAALRASL